MDYRSQSRSTLLCVLILLICLTQAEKITTVSQGPINADVSSYRVMVMQKNMILISESNKNNIYNVTLAPHRQMITLTLEEYRAKYLKTKSDKKHKVVAPALLSTKTKKLQMNIKSTLFFDLSIYDPTVFNQNQCGNCYAYSSVGSINLNNRIWHSSVPYLSPQHMTDCSSNYGCNGGNLYISMSFAKTHGLQSLQNYPISTQSTQNGINQACKDQAGVPNYKISEFYEVYPEGSNNALCMNRLNLLYNFYSMNTYMYAGFTEFMFYQSGTFVGCPAGDIDHGVHMVGFYYDFNTNYAEFKIKNSYGTDWGYGGYFYIKAQNLCHICETSYLSV